MAQIISAQFQARVGSCYPNEYPHNCAEQIPAHLTADCVLDSLSNSARFVHCALYIQCGMESFHPMTSISVSLKLNF